MLPGGGGSGGSKRFVSKNYNATAGTLGTKDTKSSLVQSAPKAGGIAVFKGSTAKLGKAVGAAATPTAAKAAPVPLNTPSARRENNGRDPNVALVPTRTGSISGGGNVWRGTTGGSSADESAADDSAFPRPAATTAKPAPWAKASSGGSGTFSANSPTAEVALDEAEKRERSGSNLSSSAGAAFAASLTSAGSVRPVLPTARSNVKKWAEIDSDEENETGDNGESNEPQIDEPVVEADDMRFTTSNSIGGPRDDSHGNAGGNGQMYRNDRPSYYNNRNSGTYSGAGGSGGGGGYRNDDNFPRNNFRRDNNYDNRGSTMSMSGSGGFNDRGPNNRFNQRNEEGFHGGMHSGGNDHYRNNRQARNQPFAAPTAVSAKDGPYKPGPPPIASFSTSTSVRSKEPQHQQQELQQHQLQPPLHQQRDVRQLPEASAGPERQFDQVPHFRSDEQPNNMMPRYLNNMQGQRTSGRGGYADAGLDDQFVIEKARRELEMLQLQQQQVQSQLAQHEQRQQQQMQLQQSQQQSLHHQQMQFSEPVQGGRTMNNSDPSPREADAFPREFASLPNDGRSSDRWNSRNASNFGPPMNFNAGGGSGFDSRGGGGGGGFDQRAGQMDQRRNYDSRGFGNNRPDIDPRGSCGASGASTDMRGGFYSRGAGFDRFQQRSSADAEPLWERAKRPPAPVVADSATVRSNAPAADKPDFDSRNDQQNERRFTATAQSEQQSSSPGPVIAKNFNNANEGAPKLTAVTVTVPAAHVESGRSFASLFPDASKSSGQEEKVAVVASNFQQQHHSSMGMNQTNTSAFRPNEYDAPVHISDIFSRFSDTMGDLNETAAAGATEPKRKMLFDPISSKFVDSSELNEPVDKRKQRPQSGSDKVHSKGAMKSRDGSGRADELAAIEAGRIEQKDDGKWAKRTLLPRKTVDVATAAAGKFTSAPKVLKRRAEEVTKDDGSKADSAGSADAMEDVTQTADIIGNNLFPSTTRHMSQQQFQEFLQLRKERREEERLKRGPRTKGMLFRYNELGEIERVLNDQEREAMSAREGGKQLKSYAVKSDRVLNKRSSTSGPAEEPSHQKAGEIADSDDSSAAAVSSRHSKRTSSKMLADGGSAAVRQRGKRNSSRFPPSDVDAASNVSPSRNERVAQMYALNQSQMHHPDAAYFGGQAPSADNRQFTGGNFYAAGGSIEVDPADAAIMGAQAYSSNRTSQGQAGYFPQQMNSMKINEDVNSYLSGDSGIGDLDIQKMAAEADANRARQPIKSFIPGVGLADENAQSPSTFGHNLPENSRWGFDQSEGQWGYNSNITYPNGEDDEDDEAGGNQRTAAAAASRFGSGARRGSRGGGGRSGGRTRGGRTRDAGRFTGARGKNEGRSSEGATDVSANAGAGRGASGIISGAGRGSSRAPRGGRSRGGRYIAGPPQIDPVTGEQMVFKNKHYKREDGPPANACDA